VFLMKKNLLSLSIAAVVGGLTLAGAAQAGVVIPGTGTAYSTTQMTATNATALDINAGGIGHIVVVPYFTANNGNNTLLNITNTDTVNGKIVKVRFRSALNSDDIFDFQLFLSPGDVWAGSVSKSVGTDRAFLTTTDSSCTLPQNINGDFIVDRLPPVSASVNSGTIDALTREGYIEILNTADVPPLNTAKGSLYYNIKHVGGNAPPCDQAVFQSLVSSDPTTEAIAAGRGLDTPSGGIYATSAIVNTANAFVAWPTETTAVNAVLSTTVKTAAHANLVFSPQTSDTYTGALGALTADPLLATGAIAAKQFDFPDLSTTYVAAPSATSASDQANKLSASLAVNSVANDYLTTKSINAKTDLTLAFPTRRYGVAVDYTQSALAGGTPLVFNTTNNYFKASNTTLAGTSGAGRYYACVATGAAANTSPLIGYDRNEQGVTANGFVISPGGSPANLAFCGEVTVAKINNPADNGVLSSLIAPLSIGTGYGEGWIQISTPGIANAGLPIIGSAYLFAKGPVTSGLATNFGYSIKHKTVATNP
jgi:hypothetical protein